MKGFALTVLAMALVAVLIPYPELKWFSLACLALIWLATPTSKPRTRVVKRRGERGY